MGRDGMGRDGMGLLTREVKVDGLENLHELLHFDSAGFIFVVLLEHRPGLYVVHSEQ